LHATWGTIGRMNMKSYGISYIAILLSLFLIGCASHKTPGKPSQPLASLQSSVTENGAAGTPLDQAKPEPDKNVEDADDGEDSPGEDAKDGNTVPAEESSLDTALELTETSHELWAAGEAEKAVEALDHAYALILKTPADADGKSSQQKDDLRFVISKRLMEIYTSRLTAVNGLHKEIPLVMNEHVEREIKSFQTIERDFFLESYKRSGKYRDEMVKSFHEAGIPEEITWLPLIESGFKVRALSKARALGLWQFIPSTGYKFGLKRTAWIDERLDPDKSTAAAIAYLKELHQVFGDWATVLAAYNCGEGNVFRVIRQQKIDYLDNFWDLYGRLPRETARYYPRFIAVLTILKDPVKYGFKLEELDKRIPYEVVAIDKPLQLSKISEHISCSYDDLVNLNAELRYAATPNTVYDLKVPFGMKDALLAKIDTMPKWSPPQVKYVVHRVRRGETLSTIAMRYRTSIQRIVETNNLKRGKLLHVGQKLKIPTRDTS
jgi:membrane-bound lytic murein transglycosylase D